MWSDAAATHQIVSYNLNMTASGQLVLLEFGTGLNSEHPVTSTITTGQWVLVTVSLLPGQTYGVTIGGATASGILAKPLPTPSQGTLEVGPTYFAASTLVSSPGWTFGYDDVVCY